MEMGRWSCVPVIILFDKQSCGWPKCRIITISTLPLTTFWPSHNCRLLLLVTVGIGLIFICSFIGAYLLTPYQKVIPETIRANYCRYPTQICQVPAKWLRSPTSCLLQISSGPKLVFCSNSTPSKVVNCCYSFEMKSSRYYFNALCVQRDVRGTTLT